MARTKQAVARKGTVIRRYMRSRSQVALDIMKIRRKITNVDVYGADDDVYNALRRLDDELDDLSHTVLALKVPQKVTER